MSLIINALLYLWELLKLWINTLFIIPVKKPDMLWILLPIWIGWFLAEFFQEKKGTSMGNAISNAVIVGWGSIDWVRQTVSFIADKVLIGFWDIAVRFFMAAIVFGYGVLIVYLGLKGKEMIKYIGRIREVTYVFAMFTPVFYKAIPFSVEHIIATILFFPVFYFVIELIDQKTPDSKAVLEEAQGLSGNGNNSNSSNSYSQPSSYSQSRPAGPPPGY